VSPPDSATKLQDKITEYLAHGVAEVWTLHRKQLGSKPSHCDGRFQNSPVCFQSERGKSNRRTATVSPSETLRSRA
jgi:Uma2 family endonuclease